MSRAGEERYVFESDWWDVQASLIRKYLFTFYPADNTIEMVSIALKMRGYIYAIKLQRKEMSICSSFY